MVLKLALGLVRVFKRRTADTETGGILRTIDICGDGATKVSDADVNCHANSPLVLPCQIISKPIPNARLTFGRAFLRKKNAPCHDTRESGVTSRNNKEGTEVLDSIRGTRDVDREANQTKYQTKENEGRAHLKLIRKVCKDIYQDS